MSFASSVPIRVAALIGLVATSSSTRAQTAPSEGSQHESLELKPGMLVVKVVQLHSNRGKVGCALFRGEKGFPNEQKHAVHGTLVHIRKREATCVFRDVPAGEYAVSILHDENDNGELDTNFFGVPTEGYGVSNNAVAGTFGPPSYEDARFRYDGSPKVLRIKLRY